MAEVETSPGNAQFFWRLDPPIPSTDTAGVADLQHFRGLLADAGLTDAATIDAAHYFRLGAGHNSKQKHKDANGGVAPTASIPPSLPCHRIGNGSRTTPKPSPASGSFGTKPSRTSGCFYSRSASSTSIARTAGGSATMKGTPPIITSSRSGSGSKTRTPKTEIRTEGRNPERQLVHR